MLDKTNFRCLVHKYREVLHNSHMVCNLILNLLGKHVDYILFCVCQLMYQALRGAFVNESIVASSPAPKRSLIALVKIHKLTIVIGFIGAKATAISMTT